MTKHDRVNRPVFFVGMGRSGTTIVFEALARHPVLAWPTNYCEWMPNNLFMNALVPLVDCLGLRGKKKQYGRTIPGNRFLPQPDEAYAFWDYYTRENFARSFLEGKKADPETVRRVHNAVARLISWEGKSRFAAKLTGPGRITFLSSIFPDALFVHVVRDGRSVVESLLRQSFWIDKGGLDEPFWDGLPEDIVRAWEASGKDGAVLTALQWRHVVQSIRSDALHLPGDSFLEIRYEDFVQGAGKILESICVFAGLSIPEAISGLKSYPKNSFKNMNEKWQSMDKSSLDRITEVMQPTLSELGYA